MGELLCDTLVEAEDADALSFVLLNNESVIAEKSSFTVVTGDPFTDDIGRKVWHGGRVLLETRRNRNIHQEGLFPFFERKR